MEGRCIYVSILNPSSLKLVNNSFVNCPSGSFYQKIIFQNEILNFDVDSCKFINNKMTNFESCPQIMVQNKVITHTESIFNLNFINCYFEKNSCPEKGGAIQDSKNNTKVFFNNCQFIENKADDKGGAIAILTHIECKIENCYFSKTNH